MILRRNDNEHLHYSEKKSFQIYYYSCTFIVCRPTWKKKDKHTADLFILKAASSSKLSCYSRRKATSRQYVTSVYVSYVSTSNTEAYDSKTPRRQTASFRPRSRRKRLFWPNKKCVNKRQKTTMVEVTISIVTKNMNCYNNNWNCHQSRQFVPWGSSLHYRFLRDGKLLQPMVATSMARYFHRAEPFCSEWQWDRYIVSRYAKTRVITVKSSHSKKGGRCF